MWGKTYVNLKTQTHIPKHTPTPTGPTVIHTIFLCKQVLKFVYMSVCVCVKFAHSSFMNEYIVAK